MTEVMGLPTYFDKGRMVHVEDDVQNVIRDMRAISDRLYCWFDESSSEFHICERCLDGTDRLVFSARELDQRVIHRLRQADHWHGHDSPRNVLGDSDDVVARIDKENAKLEEEIRERGRDQIRDAGERLVWALDLVHDRPSVGGSISVPKDI